MLDTLIGDDMYGSVATPNTSEVHATEYNSVLSAFSVAVTASPGVAVLIAPSSI